MRRRQRVTKSILVFLGTFIVSINFVNAIKVKWKPGDENARRFPIDRTSQTDRSITTEQSTRIQIDEKMQNFRRFSNDRTLQNVRRIPDRQFPIDRQLKHMRFPDGRILQSIKNIPINRTLPSSPTASTTQKNRRFSIGRTPSNDRRISTQITIPNIRRMHIDDIMQYDRGLSADRRIPNDKRMEYTRRLHSPNVTDVIKQSKIPINVNRLLEHNRRSRNELKEKIDRLIQNENTHIETRERDDSRFKNGQLRNVLKEQNRRMMVKHNHKMNDERKSPITPNPIRMRAIHEEPTATSEQELPSEEWNSKEYTYKKHWPQPEATSSGWSNFWNSIVELMSKAYSPPSGEKLTITTCYCIATTYISADQDFKRYYEMRHFYENNVEFEIGYLVAEIISKYQRMLELFHMATEYFYKHQATKYAPSTYVLYLYTNVLEMGTVITHLCNMLTEVEDKYQFIPVPQSGFSDYHLIKLTDDKEIVHMATQVLEYERKMAKLKREKLREQRRLRDKNLHIGMVVTTVNRRPKHRSWPMVYGWSIEWYW